MELSEALFSFEYNGEDFTINTAKSISLKGCKWVASDLPPEFCVIFVHDFFSFASQNHDFIDVLTSHGAAVYACDHLGHGRSPGERIFLEIEDVTEEIIQVIQLAKTEYPNLPLYLLGQNGGSLAILSSVLHNSLNEFKSAIKGIILESPWVCSWSQKQYGIFETVLMMLLNKISPTFLFDIDFSFFTDEDIPKQYVQMSQKCALYFPFITPKLYLSAMKEITFVRQNIQNWPKIPTFYAIGQRDAVLDQTQLQQFIGSIETNKNLIVKEYDSGHQISKGPARPEYMQDIFDFVQKHRR